MFEVEDRRIAIASSDMTNREYLRHRTISSHEHLDALISARISADLKGYADLLMIHAAIVPHLEMQLRDCPILADLPDRARRWRAERLRRDVKALGLRFPEQSILTFDGNGLAPIGLSYVLEGSRLGSALMARKYTGRLGKDLPMAFLRHGERPPLWSSFVTWLDGRRWSATQLEEIVAAAQSLFEAYEREVCARY